MRFLINITIILLMGFPMCAQTGMSITGGSFEIYTKASDIGTRYNSLGITDAQFKSIENAMYANSTFMFGNIYEKGEKVATNLPMRYNAYSDDIEVKIKNTDEDSQPLIKNNQLSVKTPLDYYIFIDNGQNKERSGYMNVLFDGENYKLYKKVIVSFQPSVPAKTSYDNDTPPSFKQTTFYYLVQNGNLTEIPSRKSQIIDMLDKEKSGMKTYIKKNGLDVRKEDGIIRAVTQLNSL